MNAGRKFEIQQMTLGQSGFSLIEIMVALMIGLFLMAGIIQIFMGSKASYSTTENLSRIQENGRLAIELLGRDLRMAGYKGCDSKAPVTNTLNSVSSSTNPALSWSLRSEEIQGFNASGTTWSPSLDSAISGLQMIAGTDVLTVRVMDDLGLNVTGQPSIQAGCTASVSSTADLKITNNTLLQDNDILFLSNCDRAAVFQITNFNSQENVVHNTGGTSPGNFTKDLGGCLIGAGVMKQSTKTYFIRTGASGRPALWRHVDTDTTDNPKELVEGIENMQILYGVDTDNDKNADQYNTGDVVNGASNWPDVVSVRISLLIQSMDDRIATAQQTYEYNGTTTTATDRRLRQVFTTLISVRNRLP